MEIRDILISLGILLIIISISSFSFMGQGPSIVKAVSDKYPLMTSENGVLTYSSKDDLSSTVTDIVSQKEPYDQKVDTTGKSILLYNEAVIVVREQNSFTEIEVIKDHQNAYNRHRSTMILFWGSNPYRNGRIRTPRSIRQGSIGSSPSLGGGFGFGK